MRKLDKKKDKKTKTKEKERQKSNSLMEKQSNHVEL